MRVILVGAWASYSVKDIEDGYLKGLRHLLGEENVYHYQLSARLDKASADLMRAWRNKGKVWAKPNNTDIAYYAGKDLIERALWHKADWIIVVGGALFHPQIIQFLRNCGPNPDKKFHFAALLTESPYEDEQQKNLISWFDIAWTNERTSVLPLREVNPFTFYLAHAYEPDRHKPAMQIDDDRNVDWAGGRGKPIVVKERTLPKHDVVFVGTGFWERQNLLAAIDWSGIDLGLYGAWPLLPSRHPLRKYIRGSILKNDTTAALYRRAKIGLNLYRTSLTFGEYSQHITGAESLNPRALELAACETFQISDYRKEVEEVFDGGVPTFIEPKELEKVIRDFLLYPDARAVHAKASRNSIMEGYSYSDRAKQIVSDMVKYEAKVCEPRQ